MSKFNEKSTVLKNNKLDTKTNLDDIDGDITNKKTIEKKKSKHDISDTDLDLEINIKKHKSTKDKKNKKSKKKYDSDPSDDDNSDEMINTSVKKNISKNALERKADTSKSKKDNKSKDKKNSDKNANQTKKSKNIIVENEKHPDHNKKGKRVIIDSDEEITKKLDKNEKKDSKILEIKTTQTAALKQAIERISNFISDCCMVFVRPDENIKEQDDDFYEEVIDINDDDDNNNFSKKLKKSHKSPNSNKNNPNINTGGIRILRLTENKSILIKLSLKASGFDYFRCDEPKITIGVDMNNLHGLLKMVNDDDTIILYINRDVRSVLHIRSINENNESSQETEIELYLMEISNPELPIPQASFQNKITMDSDNFHTICKHLNNNSSFVEITSINNEILFRGQNEGGKVTMSYRDTNFSNKKKDKSEQVVQGVFELKNLMGFSKCNKLCPRIEIYLKNDFPLVLVIGIGTLGKMYVFLTPIENINN